MSVHNWCLFGDTRTNTILQTGLSIRFQGFGLWVCRAYRSCVVLKLSVRFRADNNISELMRRVSRAYLGRVWSLGFGV